MGFLEEIAEAARRLATRDDWYYKSEPYILEVRSTPAVSLIPIGIQFMILPLGPENYRVRRVFRQSVTPTLGGLVAEERGLLWREITVTGSFGMKPKFGFDTSLGPDPTLITPLGGILSGPAWTRRMIRNYFEKYAELKADPLTAKDTQMLWHDTKTGDSWLVVPESIDVDRNTTRRTQYPWSFQLKAIAKADLVLPAFPQAVLDGFAATQAAISAIDKAAANVKSGTTEGSRIQLEIAFFSPGLAAVLTDIETLLAEAKAFTDGDTETIASGRDTVVETAARLQTELDTMELAGDLPNAVRQNYQMVLDGIHAMAAQSSAYGTTYQATAAGIAESESGAAQDATALSEDGSQTALEALAEAGPPASAAAMASQVGRSTDQDLVDAGALSKPRIFANYSGFRDYAVTSVDSLQSIAARLLGDGALWYDIAIVNGLKSPYISLSGIPNTVKPGDVISIPQFNAAGTSAIVAEGSEPGDEVLGRDLALAETAASAPGRPSVDLQIDQRTMQDFKSISGFGNFAQAIQLRLWTEQQTMPLAPEYGLPRVIGVKSTGAFLTLLQLSYEQTIRQDSRVQSIGAIRFEPVDDLIEVDVDVITKGAGSTRAVSTALV